MAQVSISIKDFSYDPPVSNVSAGDTVEWTNTGTRIHTVTADHGEFKSEDLANGDTFPYVVAGPAGDVGYHCIHHAHMKGILRVA